MALKACKECSKEISTEASACPHCGKTNPTENSVSAPAAVLIVMALLLFIGSLVGSGATSFEPESPAPVPVSASPAPVLKTQEEAALEQVDLDFTWRKDAFGSIMVATFTIKNRGLRPIKDFTIVCQHSGPSGTVMDRNSETLYEIVPAGRTRVFRDINMGFIADQAVSSSCRVTELALI